MVRLTGQDYLAYGLHMLWLLPLAVAFGMASSTVMGFSTTLGFVSMTAFLSDASLLTFTAMLAMTPIMIMTGWRWPQRLKKPLGLYAFSYSGIHFIIFSGGFNFQPADIVSGAVSTAMLAAGSIAFLGLMPLAITSNRWSMQLLGRNWKRLHRLTYVVAIFILLHLFFLGQALPWTILYTFLLAVRLPFIRRSIIRWRSDRSRTTIKSNTYPGDSYAMD